MIKIQNLTKRFGTRVAVDNISFEVEPGDVLGFLGPNGAGKSTTMKIICGFLSMNEGRISVCGHDVVAQAIAAKSCIGYLPEGAPSYDDMTVIGFLRFISQIRRIDSADRNERLQYVIDELKIEDVLQQRIDTLSKGFKRRVGLAQALIHDPQVLIMDEPTDGLDPNQKHHVRELINSLSKEKIVVISTHILEEVEAVCTRAMIVAHGRILIDSTPQDLIGKSRYHRAISVTADNREAVDRLCKGETGVEMIRHMPPGHQWMVFAKEGKQGVVYEHLHRQMRESSVGVQDIRMESGRLDEVFRDITEGSLA